MQMGHGVYTLNPLVMISFSNVKVFCCSCCKWTMRRVIKWLNLINLYETQTQSSNRRGRTLSVGLISGLGRTNTSTQKTELKRKLFEKLNRH